MTKVVNRWYNRHHLLLSKVIKMAVRAAAPPRGVEPFVGSKVLKVAIRASVPSGGIRLFGSNNKNDNKVLKVAKTITLTPTTTWRGQTSLTMIQIAAWQSHRGAHRSHLPIGRSQIFLFFGGRHNEETEKERIRMMATASQSHKGSHRSQSPICWSGPISGGFDHFTSSFPFEIA